MIKDYETPMLVNGVDLGAVKLRMRFGVYRGDTKVIEDTTVSNITSKKHCRI